MQEILLGVGGSAIGAMFVGNGLDTIKGVGAGIGKVFAGLLSPLRVYIEGVGAREMFESPVLFGSFLSHLFYAYEDAIPPAAAPGAG